MHEGNCFDSIDPMLGIGSEGSILLPLYRPWELLPTLIH
jgi:hypothetical protein